MNCPRCGSERHTSAGPNYICKDCRRHFVKKPRCIPVPISERPSCIECGASNPYAGWRDRERIWTCRACGRHYMNTARQKEVESPSEVQIV